MRILYFYGLISSPNSTKAQFFKNKLSKSEKFLFEIVDIHRSVNDFQNMKPSKIINQIKGYITEKEYTDFILMGSSFGGLLSTWFYSMYPALVNKLILIAPALKMSEEMILKVFDTTSEVWKSNNAIYIDHPRFGINTPLNYSFLEDLRNNPPPDFLNIPFKIPTLILHGKNDSVVPISWSKEISQSNHNVKLMELDTDHKQLDKLNLIWKNVYEFLNN